MNRLSLGQKVMSLIIVELISYSMVTGIAISQIRSVGDEVRQMANLYLPLFAETESIRQHMLTQRLHLQEIISIGERVVYDKGAEDIFIASRERYRRTHVLIVEDIAAARRLLEAMREGPGHTGRTVFDLQKRLAEHLKRVGEAGFQHYAQAQRLFMHVESGSFLMGLELLADISASEVVLTAAVDALVGDLLKLKSASVAYAEQVQDEASGITIIVALATICAGLGIIYLIIQRSITVPMHQLTETIESFNRSSDVTESIPERRLMARGDELGMVSRSFNRLKKVLVERGHALRAAKEEAEHVNRAKTQFLAAASHDLRQPLHAMQMYIAALRGRIREPEALAIVEDIETVSTTTGRLLNALLDVSHLEAGNVRVRKQDFLVADLLERVSRAFSPIAERKGLDFRVVPSGATVHSDPDLLERVLANFVSNAVNYTRLGRVLVGCRSYGDTVAIEVHDSGPGIPEDQHEAIFDDFYQLGDAKRQRGRGIGLGLSIVRRLSVLLGHSVSVASKPGVGSCFAVRVPRATRVIRRMRRIAPEAVDSTAEFPNARILLVEDDPLVLSSTALLLESWGFTVISVRSSGEASEALAGPSAKPDLILADYRLDEDVTGPLVVQTVREHFKEHVPAIIMTGELDPSGIDQLSRTGYKVLQKPVRPGKLRTIIRHYLEHRPASPRSS